MTLKRVVFGIGAIIGTYLLVFLLIMIVMGFVATGDPALDVRNPSLAIMSLLGKVGLAGATGIAVGIGFTKNGWWLAALTMIAIVAMANFLLPRSLLFAVFAYDNVMFDVAYVIVASLGGKFGDYVMLRRAANKR